MGFFDSYLKPFIVKNSAPVNKGQFSFHDKTTTTKLTQDARRLVKQGRLTTQDSKRLQGILKEENFYGRPISNRRLTEVMKTRGEDYKFRQRIKKDLLTPNLKPGLTPEQIARNREAYLASRLVEEAKTGYKPEANNGLAGTYGKGPVTATAVRPEASRMGNQADKAPSDTSIHLPV